MFALAAVNCCCDDDVLALVVMGPPCGDGSCEVDANSPTATHVEHERDVWSSRLLSNIKPSCNEFNASSEMVCRKWAALDDCKSANAWLRLNAPPPPEIIRAFGSCVISLVLKLFCKPSTVDSWAQLRIRSFPSSNHITSGISAGLQMNESECYMIVYIDLWSMIALRGWKVVIRITPDLCWSTTTCFLPRIFHFCIAEYSNWNLEIYCAQLVFVHI